METKANSSLQFAIYRRMRPQMFIFPFPGHYSISSYQRLPLTGHACTHLQSSVSGVLGREDRCKLEASPGHIGRPHLTNRQKKHSLYGMVGALSSKLHMKKLSQRLNS